MRITTPNGAALSVVAEFPPGDGPFPAMVLAPGQSYHMGKPVMEESARALWERGVAVFRFDWSYFTAHPQGQPSDDLSAEMTEMQSVIAAAVGHPMVQADQVSVGGKSLGSLVAWRAFAADQGLRSAVLLTPLLSRLPEGSTVPQSYADEHYPGLQAEHRPVLLVAGDQDPSCAPSIVYALAAASAGPAQVAMVGGDHAFEDQALNGAAADAARAKNIAAASVLAARFVAEVSGTSAVA